MALPFLDGLDDVQLGQVLQYAYTMLDDRDDDIVTDDELAAATESDRRLLVETARQLTGNAPDDTTALPSVRDVIEAMVTASPDIEPVIEAGAERARRVGSLPSTDLAMNVLVIAAAVAVIHPRLNIKRTRSGTEEDLEISVKAGTSEAFGKLVDAVLRYLGRVSQPSQVTPGSPEAGGDGPVE
jgi:hypothetical protein